MAPRPKRPVRMIPVCFPQPCIPGSTAARKALQCTSRLWRGHNGSEKTHFCTFDKKPLKSEEIHRIGEEENRRVARKIGLVTQAQSRNQQAARSNRCTQSSVPDRQSFRDAGQKAQRCGFKVRGKTLDTEAAAGEKIDRSSRGAY